MSVYLYNMFKLLKHLKKQLGCKRSSNMQLPYTLIRLGSSKVLRTRSEMKSVTNSKGWCFEARRCLFAYPSTILLRIRSNGI